MSAYASVPIDERISEAREYIAQAETIEHPSAVKPIIDVLGPLFWYSELAEEWTELFEHHDYVNTNITAEEWAEARRFLSTMRESVDALAAEVAGWVCPGGRQDQVRQSMTTALTMGLKLDLLAHRMAVAAVIDPK